MDLLECGFGEHIRKYFMVKPLKNCDMWLNPRRLCDNRIHEDRVNLKSL